LLGVWPQVIGIPVSSGAVGISRPAAGVLKAKTMRQMRRKRYETENNILRIKSCRIRRIKWREGVMKSITL
jgi:hypothetical protein